MLGQGQFEPHPPGTGGDAAQHEVALLVAVDVVQELEIVEVDEQDDGSDVMSAGRDPFVHLVEEQAAVRQAGECDPR